MKQNKDIQDNEIRVLGSESKSKHPPKPVLWKCGMFGLITIGMVVASISLLKDKKTESDEPGYFETVPEIMESSQPKIDRLGTDVDPLVRGFTQAIDTIINDIPLRIYIPHNANMTLHVGNVNKEDTSIVFAAQAADIRRDNKKIVGAFVLKGKPLAWGLSKIGYCAIIDDEITIGVADNSPLFESATEKEGYFFRQYPLVNNGKLVENEPKNKAIRRSICDRNGEIMMIESLSTESFHDFAQALVDLGVKNAIYLVGSTSFGWAVDENDDRIEFGIENKNLPPNTSYIIWRRNEE
ncbi:hypothetical protein [Parabacteroides sp. PF5-6]|uniref:hypothetical protein n=1 Tax=Parabacteroides sp. PF5-6 TaxID=1742403 RepID=UPI002404FB54|nr:hypothetical protein [Parabacteroides sp. PF5-6]MDF9828843.1 hypothetical protein [Parabacteroides sp. PF5-6]